MRKGGKFDLRPGRVAKGLSTPLYLHLQQREGQHNWHKGTIAT